MKRSEDYSKSWYEELERDMPGIDSTVIELLNTQILGLCYFLKLSNKCHENWPSGHDGDEPRKWPGFHRFAKVRSTLRVKKRRYFARLPMKQFGSFSVKSIIPGFCVLILLAKRHKPPKQVNLTQNSVIQLYILVQANISTEKVSEKFLQEMQTNMWSMHLLNGISINLLVTEICSH